MEHKSTDSLEDNTGSCPSRKTLRAQKLKERLSLSSAQWSQASAQLARHLDMYLASQGIPRAGQVVAFCWPIQNEPDIRSLAQRWRTMGVSVALPVVVGAGQPLQFRAWLEHGELQTDRYGIPTPVDGPWVTPEILCLPGNAFDAAGYRLGYGGGFFDRTLAILQPRPLVVGLCFDAALVPDLRPEPHDLPVDVVITESGLKKPPSFSGDMVKIAASS